jgi:hypothetical protein
LFVTLPSPTSVEVTVSHEGAADKVPVPVCLRNFPVVVVFPARRVFELAPLPYITSPSIVTGERALKAAADVVWPVPPMLIDITPEICVATTGIVFMVMDFFAFAALLSSIRSISAPTGIGSGFPCLESQS